MNNFVPKREEITKIVEDLEKTMSKHRLLLVGNELLTRYVLVDPFLKALGWNTSNPEEVKVNFKVKGKRRKWVDYALFLGKEKVAFVEAKPYGASYNERRNFRQLINYCKLDGMPLGIITDGGCWLVYNVSLPGPPNKKLIFEMNFTDLSKVVQHSLKLSPNRIKNLLRA